MLVQEKYQFILNLMAATHLKQTETGNENLEKYVVLKQQLEEHLQLIRLAGKKSVTISDNETDSLQIW